MEKDQEIKDETGDFRYINDEYKTWKEKKGPLYDIFITHGLQWPSLTVEWLPDQEGTWGKDNSVKKMIVGTQAPENEANYLMITQVLQPFEHAEFGATDADSIRLANTNEVKIIKYIKHEGEVNRARCIPQYPSIIATKAVSGEVYVFDSRNHTSQRPSGGACKPDLRLTGHSEEGFGLSWSMLKQGYLLSGSHDGQICFWDINALRHKKNLQAMEIFKAHEGVVGDVAWHTMQENLFGSVGDDGYLYMWDSRLPLAHNKPVLSVLAHQDELFDLRNFDTALHTFNSHEDGVLRVGWNPKDRFILASACHGKKLVVWDYSRVGKEETTEEAKDGPPELLFVHEGHTGKVFDFSWNQVKNRLLQAWLTTTCSKYGRSLRN